MVVNRAQITGRKNKDEINLTNLLTIILTWGKFIADQRERPGDKLEIVMRNYGIEAHAGNKVKQQQVGDNQIHHASNAHASYHVAKYMIDHDIPSKYDLDSVVGSALERM